MSTIIPLDDTIAAIASAITLGKGGIAVIRVSGPDAINSCRKIVQTKSKKAWESNRVFHGYAKDIENEKLVDEILVLVMRSPNSFTGEDIVEIHCHGGIIVVNRILDILLKRSNVRLANPGEFSQRAFLNGKIDLTQAESINQLINANNIRAAEIAFKGIQGELNNQINLIKNSLIDQLAEIEARVDFDEDFQEFDYDKFSKDLNIIKEKINYLIEITERNRYIENGISIALIGKTNVGKSSLLNLLSKQDKAIVTEIPGTTRDIIEVNLIIKDIPIRIIDTAGIRNTEDYIEKIGIKKSLEMIKECDYIIYIYDLKSGLNQDDEEIIEKIPANKLISILGNKKDLISTKNIRNKKYSDNTIFMSIKENQGEGLLIEKIIDKCGNKEFQDIEVLLNERQMSNLRDSLKNLNDTSNIIDKKLPFDFLAIELRDSIKNLAKLTGEELTEELLDNIFSKFCIGK